MTNSKCIIYGLVDPRTLMVRYVGLSSNGLVRPKTHRNQSVLAVDRTRKANWIRSLLADGLDYQIVVLQESSVDRLNEDEVWWLKYGQASGWPLTNLRGGGDVQFGWSVEPETRAKIAAAHRGKTLTPEHRAKISAGLKRVPRSARPPRSQLGSPEHRAKLSAASRARWADLEWKAKVIANRIGEVRSVEARARMSIANKARRDRERAQRGAV